MLIANLDTLRTETCRFRDDVISPLEWSKSFFFSRVMITSLIIIEHYMDRREKSIYDNRMVCSPWESVEDDEFKKNIILESL